MAESSVRRSALVALFLGLGIAACDRGEEERDAPPPPAEADVPVDTASSVTEADTAAAAFHDRVVVYVEATRRDVENASAGQEVDQLATAYDDLMIYRASATAILERQSVPVTRVVGRQPLRFLVDGEIRAYAFEGQGPLDLVVLYAPGREPRALSPVDVAADPGVVTEYFGGATRE